MTNLYRPLPENLVKAFRSQFPKERYNIHDTIRGGLIAHPCRGFKMPNEACLVEWGPEGITIGNTPSAYYRGLTLAPELFAYHHVFMENLITEWYLRRFGKFPALNHRQVVIKHGYHNYERCESVVLRYITNLTPSDSVKSWSDEIKNTHEWRKAYNDVWYWAYCRNVSHLQWNEGPMVVPTNWRKNIQVRRDKLKRLAEFSEVFAKPGFEFIRERDQCWLGGTVNADADRFDQFVRGSGWLVDDQYGRPDCWSVLDPENIQKIAQMPAVALAHYLRLIYFVDDKWDGFVQQAFKAGVLSAIAGRARELVGESV